MIQIGKYSVLEVLRDTSAGWFLGDSEGNEVLLPGKFIPKDKEVGDHIEVYVYLDNLGRLISTTQTAKIELYEVALLKVTQVTDYGAFLDFGIDKELFVPKKEQIVTMKEGYSYLVYMYIDGETERLTGSAKIDQFLENEEMELKENDEVLVTVWRKTNLGWAVIVNHSYEGLIYDNELFRGVRVGDQITAYVNKIREHNKLDIRLQAQGMVHIEDSAALVLEKLTEAGGSLPFNDKSSPEDIKKAFKMSKKAFKKALGSLYKLRKISIEEKGITIIE